MCNRLVIHLLVFSGLFLKGSILDAQDIESYVEYWDRSFETGDYDSLLADRLYREILQLPAPRMLEDACDISAYFREKPVTPVEVNRLLQKATAYQLAGNQICSRKINRELLTRVQGTSPAAHEVLIHYINHLLYFGNFREADSTALIAFSQIEESDELYGNLLLAAANVNYRNNHLELALEQLRYALELARKNKDQYLEAQLLTVLGRTTRDLYTGASLEALQHHFTALSLVSDHRDTSLTCMNLMSIGLNYLDAAQYDDFLEYSNQVLILLKRHEDIRQTIRLTSGFGSFLEKTGALDKAHVLYQKTLQLSQKTGNDYFIYDTYIRLAGIMTKRDNFNEAEALLDRAMKYAGEFPIPYLAFYQLEKSRGSDAKAIEYLEKTFDDTNSRYAEWSAQQLNRWQAFYHSEEKERLLNEKETLLNLANSQRNKLTVAVILIALLLLITIYGLIRQLQSKRTIARQKALTEQQAEELLQLDRLKTRFYANISHELRTPLTLILAPVSNLMKSADPGSNAYNLLSIIKRNGEHLQHMIQDLLDLGKLENKKLELDEEPTRLHDFIHRIVQNFEDLARSRGLQFRFHSMVPPGLIVHVDRGKLQTIINNLLGNALKFTPPGSDSYVAIEAGLDDDRLKLFFTDTGRGISSRDLPHIFNRYYQGSDKDAPIEGGAGIGLSLCMELATLMGGTVKVRSPHPVSGNQGSVFQLDIPLHPAPDAPVIRETGPMLIQKGSFLTPVSLSEDGRLPVSGKETILLVEDNPEMLDFICQLLSPRYRVLTSKNGREAMKLLESTENRPPDLIISDVMMPEMDGFQLLEKVKSNEQLRTLPFILLTARAAITDRLHALRTGVDDYLLKPFVEDELLARVDHLIENYRHRKKAMEPSAVPDSAGSETTGTERIRPVSDEEMEWLAGLEAFVIKNLGNTQLTAEDIAQEMLVSRSTLIRQLTRLTGLPPGEYLNQARYREALRLLETGSCRSVKAVAYKVGFLQVKYFSRQFRQRYGKLPSAYFR